MAPGGVQAQGPLAEGSLLERWTLSYVAEGWGPRWIDAELSAADSVGAPRYRAELSGEFLRLGSSLDQRVARLDLFARYPLTPRVALIASGSSGVWESEAFGRRFMETPRSQSVAVGASTGIRGSPPAITAAALLGWDEGPGAWARLTARGASWTGSLSGWTTTARESQYFFPADSLRDIGVQHRSQGTEVTGAGELRFAGVLLRPSAFWRVELVRPSSEYRSTAFLYTSLGGRTDAARLALGVDGASKGGRLSYRERRVDLDSGITRSALAAGWVSYARSGFNAWRLEGWTADPARRWTLAVENDRVSGEISARVESWPFVSLWESVTVQAYRLDGEVGGGAKTVTLERASFGGGWDWGVQVGRYEVRGARESWFVTNFGFGRTGEESTEASPNPVYLLGVEAARSFRLAVGELGVRVTGQVPVHSEGDEEPDPDPPPPGEGDRQVAGALVLSASWTW